MFARAATANPQAGEPKLGYAIALALQGDDDLAAYAMQRVHRYEEDVLDRPHAVPDAALTTLADRYEYQSGDEARLMRGAVARLRAAGHHAQQADEPDEDAYPTDP